MFDDWNVWYEQVRRRSLVSLVEGIYVKFILKYIADRASKPPPPPENIWKEFSEPRYRVRRRSIRRSSYNTKESLQCVRKLSVVAKGAHYDEVSIDRIRELTAGFKERSYVSYTFSANYKAIATPKFVEGLLPRPRGAPALTSVE